MPKKNPGGARRPPVAGAPPKAPFSRPFAVDRLHTDAATDITVNADADERLALAQLDGMERVDRLEGRFRVARLGSGARVTGEVEAEVVQTCVVSLESFTAVVREPVDVRYAPQEQVAELEAAAARNSGDSFEEVVDPAEVPDPIVEGRIDLGALAAEFLALGLDPYPHKPGVQFEAEAREAEAREAERDNVSPFAALRARQGKS